MPRSPLFSKWKVAQAQCASVESGLPGAAVQVISDFGWEVPASFGPVEAEYWALKDEAGLVDLSHRGRILVRGKDAPRFLHGMVTNEVQGLGIGQGNYAFLLDVHGHILADLQVLRLESESFLLNFEPQVSQVVFDQLDRHIISDLVELEDYRDQLACLGIEGPGASRALRQVAGIDLPAMKFLDHFYCEEISSRLIRGALIGEEGYWILTSPERAIELWEMILRKPTAEQETPDVSPQPSERLSRIPEVSGAKPARVRPVGLLAREICRIEAGIPRYGIDITEKNLPQETGQVHAISFTKGCYIGQEVVERIRSRGHVNRSLVRLVFQGRQEVPAQTEIFFEDQPVGFVTSSAYSFALQRTVALGYLRREYSSPGSQIMVATVPAEVTAL